MNIQRTSAFRLPKTGSGVLLAYRAGGCGSSLAASLWQLAWYTRWPTLMASGQTNSWASSSHRVSNFSWQIGQTLFARIGSSGTGMYWSFGAFFSAAAAPPMPEDASPSPPCPTWSSSMVSRLLIQSW